MTLKTIAIAVSKLKDYTGKKPSLEQYTTPSDIAARLSWLAFMNGDIEDKAVSDLGCGNGILGISALLLGARSVTFVDVDERALDITESNCKSLKFENYKLVNENVADFHEKCDTVIMNPPFGVQTPGLDILFLKQAALLAKKVYLVYKGDGLKIIVKNLPNHKITLLDEAELALKNQFSFHTREKSKTKIILVKIE
ncbi:putative S-adenosylmethionine-dependent methyltransferase [Candidatus Tiddalikarchaeum anstoanum]|nr:putative S-adenosylmethionine-dependent methyltransferase [Candidatus Tiddalikarchaeum anstoanum]